MGANMLRDKLRVRRFRQAGLCGGILDLAKQPFDFLRYRIVGALLDAREVLGVPARQGDAVGLEQLDRKSVGARGGAASGI